MNVRFFDAHYRTNVRTGLLVVLVVAAAPLAWAQQPDAAAFFRQNCASCHTIGGGRLVGPDLKDVATRRDRGWLQNFLPNPKAAIEGGDVYAQRLQKEANGVVMPALPGMESARIVGLLDLIDAESKLPRSQFAGAKISDRPFTATDVADGRALFTGAKRLSAGGPPCMSCHTINGLGGLGGGRLGPDLTLVFERLQGRKGLGAWLTAPQSPTMAPVFKTKGLTEQEILPLLALFEDSAKRGGQVNTASMLSFFLISLGGMVVGLVSLDAIWKKRLRGVRRALLDKRKRGQQ